MSIPTTLQERMAEARASSEAAMIVRLLNDAVAEPSTKRFVKGRSLRIERWMQLARVASEQVNGLQALAKVAPRRPSRAKPIPTVPATGQPIEPGEAASAA